MLQETPVSQWPVYGVGESGCSNFTLERLSIANNKMSSSAVQVFSFLGTFAFLGIEHK